VRIPAALENDPVERFAVASLLLSPDDVRILAQNASKFQSFRKKTTWVALPFGS